MKLWTWAVALLSLSSLGCQKESSVTELKDDSDASASTKSLSPLDTLLSAGLVIDFYEQSHSERKVWLARNLIALADTSGSLDAAASQPCQMSLQEQGQAQRFVLTLAEKFAYALPNGRVVYCREGKLSWAGQDPTLREKAIQAGASTEEVDKIIFYRVPLDIPNSFASLNAKNEGTIVLFDGLAQSSRQNALDVESIALGILLHEIGHINELRKDNQNTLRAIQDRLKDACKARNKSDDTPYTPRVEACRKSLGPVSRPRKYTADQFIVDVLARKKYPPTLQPGDIARFFRAQPALGRDSFDAHPDGVERAIQFERNLDRVGVR